MGDSLGTYGGMCCVWEPRDSKGYVATLALTPHPLGLDFHPVSPISTFSLIPTTSTPFLGRFFVTMGSQSAQLLVFNLPDPPGGGGYVATLPAFGPPLILPPTLKRWGPPRPQGLCSHVAHLWATSDFAPCSEAVGTP